MPQWGWYWLLIGLMLVYPLYVSLRHSAFESKRWTESDHPPGGS